MNLSALLGCLFSLQWSGLRQICAASQPPLVPEECITVPSPASGPGLEVPNLHIHACRVSTYKLEIPHSSGSPERKRKRQNQLRIKFLKLNYKLCVKISRCCFGQWGTNLRSSLKGQGNKRNLTDAAFLPSSVGTTLSSYCALPKTRSKPSVPLKELCRC